MHEFCIKECIDAAIAADGDDAKLRAAEVIFHVKCQENIEEPFATAKSMGFPAEWTVTTTQNRRKLFWSPDGLIFYSFPSLDSKRVILLSPMKCAMLFTIIFHKAGRLSKRGPA